MKDIAIGAFIATVACLVTLIIPMAQKITELEHEAIQLNYAEHNPTNGNWQWKTNQ